MAKPLTWIESPTGNWISTGTRFLISQTYRVGHTGSERVKLIDRIGGKEKGVAVKVVHLCLSAGDAMLLAAVLNAQCPEKA